MKKVKYVLSLLLVAAMSLSFSACGGDGGGSSSGSDQSGADGGGDDVITEDFMPRLIGKWYYIEEGTASTSTGSYKTILLYTLTIKPDNTFETNYCARYSKDNYTSTVPGFESHGTFTLSSNNMIVTYSNGGKYNWNFSRDGLNQGLLKIIEKAEGSTDVENIEYKRFNYPSDDDCLNAYVPGGGSGGDEGTGGEDEYEPSGDVDVQGTVQGRIKAYGTEYSNVARTADGKTTTVHYEYRASTGKYYVYGGTWDSNPSANGGKGVRYDAQKGYNSIRINGGAYYDSSTKTRYNWEIYLQVTLP